MHADFSGNFSAVPKVKVILAAKRMHLSPKQASSKDDLKVNAILELPPKQVSSKDTDKAMEVDDQMEKLWVKIEDR